MPAPKAPVVEERDGELYVGGFKATDIVNLAASWQKAEDSLHEFVRQAWPQVEGGRPFVDGWHIGALTEHLDALNRGQIKKLLINVPPRSSKSTILSVMWPAWTWLKRPELQINFASHDAGLVIRDSLKCRALMQGTWYRNRWSSRFTIKEEGSKQDSYKNDKFGHREAYSIAAGVTGFGADWWAVDDGNDASDQYSEAALEFANNWLDTVLSTRFNDFNEGRLVVCQQRISEKDQSGHLLAKYGKEIVHLMLPMEFETKRRCVTVPVRFGSKIPWVDPRRKEGELLCPKRWDSDTVKGIKRGLKSAYAISGQLQQNPAPAEGGMIKKKWFPMWKASEAPPLDFVVQSWDTATSKSEDAAYTACTTWGVFQNNDLPNAILLSMWRDRYEYPDLRKMIIRMAADYLDDDFENPLKKPDSKRQPDMVLIENKSSGADLVPDLQRAGVEGVMRFDPTKYGDKIGRVRRITHILEDGRVWLPGQGPTFQFLKPWADEALMQFAMFPKAESRDLVDTMTQALLKLDASGWIWHSHNPKPEPDTDMLIRQAAQQQSLSPY